MHQFTIPVKLIDHLSNIECVLKDVLDVYHQKPFILSNHIKSQSCFSGLFFKNQINYGIIHSVV